MIFFSKFWKILKNIENSEKCCKYLKSLKILKNVQHFERKFSKKLNYLRKNFENFKKTIATIFFNSIVKSSKTNEDKKLKY